MTNARWEYKSVMVNVGGFFGPNVQPDALDAEMNGYGDAGWELVSAFDVNRGHGSTSAIVAMFKRPRN